MGLEHLGGESGWVFCRLLSLFFFRAHGDLVELVGFTRALLLILSVLLGINMEPPAKKSRKLFDDDSSSDSGDESGGVPVNNGVTFKVNEEYARRFEHNKKREEMQKRTFICIIFLCIYEY